MLINHELKAIYVINPKCGSTYINKILSIHYGFMFTDYESPYYQEFVDTELPRIVTSRTGFYRAYQNSAIYNKMMNMNEERWNTYYKFSFVRNPYEKLVSGFHFFRNEPAVVKFYKKDSPDLYNNFSTFLGSVENLAPLTIGHVFITQYEHIMDDLGSVEHIDYIGNLETIDADLLCILQRMGVANFPHLSSPVHTKWRNITDHATNIKDYFNTPELIKLGNRLVSPDFSITEIRANYPVLIESDYYADKKLV